MNRYGHSKAANILENKLDLMKSNQPREVISRNLFKLNTTINSIAKSNLTTELKKWLIELAQDYYIAHINLLKNVNGEIETYTKNVIKANCNTELNKIKT